MTLEIRRIPLPVTLVGGAPLATDLLAEALAHAPTAFAADGGAATLMRAGRLPEAVIGDLDSLPPDLRETLGARVVHVADQDSTDLEKCLSLIDAPLILGAGFIGGRLDHTLAALCAIAARGARPVVLLGEEEVAMHLAAPVEIELDPGARVSLMPLAPVRVVSRGLRWETGALDLSPLGRIGSSNEALGRVSLAPEGPGTILMLERRALGALLAARGAGAPSRFVSPGLA